MKDVSVMMKPASGICNMRCSYCFYADVSSLREVKSYGIMKDAVLEQVVQRALNEADESCSFVFQGGEPTMAGLDFFRRFIRYQKKYNGKKVSVQNAIQTNGLALDDEWASFLHENHFLVGLSVDGTKDIHDYLRKDAAGKGTYQRVLKSSRLLDRYHVDFNILTVITKQTARHIVRIYRQYRKNGWNYLQFIPCLDNYGEEKGKNPYSLTPEVYGRFLKDLFDLWFEDLEGGERVYIRYFDNLMGILMGIPPESCGLLGSCHAQMVVEADGSVYPCDFYVTDTWKMGSLVCDSWGKIRESEAAGRFERESVVTEEECTDCPWNLLCRGGCRRDRDDGHQVGKNYYCEAYKEFFSYAAPRLERAARLYQV